MPRATCPPNSSKLNTVNYRLKIVSTYRFTNASISYKIVIDGQLFLEHRLPERRMSSPDIEPNRSILFRDEFVLDVISDASIRASVAPQSTHSEQKKRRRDDFFVIRVKRVPIDTRYRVVSRPTWPERINR